MKEAAHTPELVQDLQRLLDPYCLVYVHINPEGRVKIHRAEAEARLIQGGWSTFLVKVINESGSRGRLEIESPQAKPVLHRSTGAKEPKKENFLSPGDIADRWFEAALYTRRPMTPLLSGLPLDYFILQCYTREAGPREAVISLHAGEGSQDLGFRNELPILFDCVPSVKVTLGVKDHDGEPTMARFTISDGIERVGVGNSPWPEDYRLQFAQRREWENAGYKGKRLAGIYPLPSKRVALTDEYPDFYFQSQIYRADGEHVYLPPGAYNVTWTRGPEYIEQNRQIIVPENVTNHVEIFELERWIHLAAEGWYSGDHHVHAGGCSHYESPEAGVQPLAMFRQALGEDLNVSCVLSWGPCWYHQKTFFEGGVSPLSTLQNLIRYDVEVSGFPSSHAGHLCLLRLQEDDYPGTTLIEEWPSWTLPVLQWGKGQGAVVGYSHSGWGLEPMEFTEELPNYVMAKFDGIGANEFIVTVTHGAVDFISAGDTPVTWELNILYHVLNCGYRTPISGETDFPCIFDERIGMARSYAPLDGRLDFDAFTEQIRKGANYVSDGLSHIMDFQVNDARPGVNGSELHLDQPERVQISARVAAYLPETQTEEGAAIVAGGINGRPYWHLEKARKKLSRRVSVELVVNGRAVETKSITADGAIRE
ncbi:MAG: CehA/McbA family metallohydrolase, partial [Candidatus Hydrogenedentes bacterium]|nr:CehA/McbA family metallohydrolase [Candidatus Hydrogenedentota bacterium]